MICHNQIKVLCPRSGSHRKVKQIDNLCAVQDSGSLAVFKVTAMDQGQYKGPSGHFTHCNISFFLILLTRFSNVVIKIMNIGRRRIIGQASTIGFRSITPLPCEILE